MLGAIAGDVIGSVYERYPIKKTNFPLFHPRCRFTDDTVMTIAVANVILALLPEEFLLIVDKFSQISGCAGQDTGELTG